MTKDKEKDKDKESKILIGEEALLPDLESDVNSKLNITKGKGYADIQFLDKSKEINFDKREEKKEQRPLIISDIESKLKFFIKPFLVKICEKNGIKSEIIIKQEPYIPEKKEKEELYYLPDGLDRYFEDRNNPLFFRKLVEFMAPYTFDNGINVKKLIEKGFLLEIINRAEEKGLVQKTKYIEKKECRFNEVFTIAETGNKIIFTNYDGIFHEPPEKGNPILDNMIDEYLTIFDIDMPSLEELIIKAADGDKKSKSKLSKKLDNYFGTKDEQKVKATFKVPTKKAERTHFTKSILYIKKLLEIEKIESKWGQSKGVKKKETNLTTEQITNPIIQFAAEQGEGEIKDEQMAALRKYSPDIKKILDNEKGKQTYNALANIYNSLDRYKTKEELEKKLAKVCDFNYLADNFEPDKQLIIRETATKIAKKYSKK